MFFQKAKGISYKNQDDIKQIKISGDLLGRVHGELSRNIKEGVETTKLDKIAFDFIRDHKAIPSFLNYRGFKSTLCISVNQTVVHGIPNKYILRSGDIVSIDCGVYLNGFHADSAYTYQVGEISNEKKRLLQITYQSLFYGIDHARAGWRTGDIGFAVQSFVERQGYSVVRELVGHGVGRNLHEEPEVPNYGKRGKGHKLINGMVIAIEPMINMGKKEVYQLDDGWTVNTADGKPSAHYEHTVAINNGTPEILTTFEYITKEQRING
ncbi:MAG: type I methionyl aminopeptidase [Bacteroidota bacterium]|nr:type I methionyl aminopeptidase [Bacteroidota bacterium]